MQPDPARIEALAFAAGFELHHGTRLRKFGTRAQPRRIGKWPADRYADNYSIEMWSLDWYQPASWWVSIRHRQKSGQLGAALEESPQRGTLTFEQALAQAQEWEAKWEKAHD